NEEVAQKNEILSFPSKEINEIEISSLVKENTIEDTKISPKAIKDESTDLQKVIKNEAIPETAKHQDKDIHSEIQGLSKIAEKSNQKLEEGQNKEKDFGKELKIEDKFEESLIRQQKTNRKGESTFKFSDSNHDTLKEERTDKIETSKNQNNKETASKIHENTFQNQLHPKILSKHNSILSNNKSELYNAVSRQIEDSVTALLSSNKKEIKLDMSPPDLGSIKVEIITKKHNEVAISIIAKDADIKSLIDTNKNDLLNNMNDKGILVKEFSIAAGNDRNMNQRWRESSSGSSNKKIRLTGISSIAANSVEDSREKRFLTFDGKVDVYI
ncbi:MAG: flagellar hook-length control protein FliK, partial [Candidatus Schekmanbacteria bacterium]